MTQTEEGPGRKQLCCRYTTLGWTLEQAQVSVESFPGPTGSSPAVEQGKIGDLVWWVLRAALETALLWCPA